MRKLLIIWMMVAVVSCSDEDTRQVLPEGFSYLSQLDSSIQQDIRYLGANNFLGRPVAGYESSECILTDPAAEALVLVQEAVKTLGYSLKVYDCFRPQRAVDDFVQWAADPRDELMRSSYYPEVPKDELFSRGYIAERSGHSRGSTVDLTLVPLGTVVPLADPLARRYDCRASQEERYPDNSIDMGTGYDCFDLRSHTDDIGVGAEVLQRRHLLRNLMEAAGFTNYEQEWWHYTLNDEPFPDQYFDFPVK